MILTTVRPFYFFADYKGYEDEIDPNTGTTSLRVWKDKITISCAVNNNPLGELTLYTDAILQNDGIITFLRSKTYPSQNLNNKLEGLKTNPLLYPIGTVQGALWRIIEGQPLVDAWGNKNRYRYRCLLLTPKIGSVTEAAPDGSGTSNWWT